MSRRSVIYLSWRPTPLSLASDGSFHNLFCFFFNIEFLKPYTDYRAGEKEAMKLEFWCVKPYVEPKCREDEKKIKHLSVLGCNRIRKETN